MSQETVSPWAVKHWLERNIHSFYFNLEFGLYLWEYICGSVAPPASLFEWVVSMSEWETEKRLRGELQLGLFHVWTQGDKSLTPVSFSTHHSTASCSLPSFFSSFLFSLLQKNPTVPSSCLLFFQFNSSLLSACESESHYLSINKRKSSISTVILMAKYRQASQPKSYVS